MISLTFSFFHTVLTSAFEYFFVEGHPVFSEMEGWDQG